MRNIKIEKVTLNIGVGEAGDKLKNAVKLLNKITGSKAVETMTMKRIPTWGIRPKLKIGCKVTLRGKMAEDVLKRLISAVDNTLPSTKFDEYGNFSFGIREYIDIPGVEYDTEIGIIGLEAAVTLQRSGFRIKYKAKKSKIPMKHRISKDDAIKFVKNKFNLKVISKEEKYEL